MGAAIYGPYGLQQVSQVGNTYTSTTAGSSTLVTYKNNSGNTILDFKSSTNEHGIIGVYDSAGTQRIRLMGAVANSYIVNDGSHSLTIGSTTDFASAVLACSSTTQGFKPPVMTSVQRAAIGSPTTGLMVFDTDLSQICVWVGAKWQKVTQTDV